MQQRDLLKDQIEQLGQALGKILAEFLGLKNRGNTDLALEQVVKNLKTELNFDLDHLMSLDKSEAVTYLNECKFSAPHVETLAYFLLNLGTAKKDTDPKMAKRYFLKTLDLFEVCDEWSATLSLERIQEKEDITAWLAANDSATDLE